MTTTYLYFFFLKKKKDQLYKVKPQFNNQEQQKFMVGLWPRIPKASFRWSNVQNIPKKRKKKEEKRISVKQRKMLTHMRIELE